MSKPACARTWEVEAARDGRISGEALASLEIHIGKCEACTAERRFLEELGRSLRQQTEAAPDVLSHRRLRQATLERVNAEVVHPRKSPARLALPVSAVLALALVVTFLSTRRPPVPTHEAPAVVVATPAGSAEWVRRTVNGGERFTLSEGTLQLAVHRQPGDRPVVVQVPDGEIEDVGTVFRVTVRGGRTIEVVVTDGAVLFRRRSGDPVRIAAGTPWTAPPAADFPPDVAPPAVRVEPPAAKVRTTRGNGAQPTVVASSEPSSGTVGEDLAYLHVIALVREGRTHEARLAAKEYLRRYPGGFRRAEVERIAR